MHQSKIALTLVAVVLTASVAVGYYVTTRTRNVEIKTFMGIIETPLEENIDLEDWNWFHGPFYVDYLVDVTTPDITTTTYRYRSSAITSYSWAVRVDFTMEENAYSYIIDSSSWKEVNGLLTPFPHDNDFDKLSDMCCTNVTWHLYKLQNWRGGNIVWSVSGYTFRIYNIDNNPSFLENVFHPPYTLQENY